MSISRGRQESRAMMVYQNTPYPVTHHAVMMLRLKETPADFRRENFGASLEPPQLRSTLPKDMAFTAGFALLPEPVRIRGTKCRDALVPRAGGVAVAPLEEKNSAGRSRCEPGERDQEYVGP